MLIDWNDSRLKQSELQPPATYFDTLPQNIQRKIRSTRSGSISTASLLYYLFPPAVAFMIIFIGFWSMEHKGPGKRSPLMALQKVEVVEHINQNIDYFEEDMILENVNITLPEHKAEQKPKSEVEIHQIDDQLKQDIQEYLIENADEQLIQNEL